jgi:cytochrome oxidase Cu insertion factor (SCO1/SenC/PrrC family)
MDVRKALGGIGVVALMGFASGEGPDVGQPARDFVLKDSTGKSYRLSDLEGKKVVLEFIRSGSW